MTKATKAMLLEAAELMERSAKQIRATIAPESEKPLSLKDAEPLIGLTVRQMRRRIAAGAWIYGKHYIDVGNGDRPLYRVNVAEVQALMRVPPKKRLLKRQL